MREVVGESIIERDMTPSRARKRVNYYLECDLCGVVFLDKKGERTSEMRRGKAKHAFCCHAHAMRFRTEQREKTTGCKRCNKTRKELYSWWQRAGIIFSAMGIANIVTGFFRLIVAITHWLIFTKRRKHSRKKREMSAIKNTADLRTMLLDVISDVRAGKIESKEALAISSLSSRILQSARLDFDVMKTGIVQGARQSKPLSLTADEDHAETKALGEAKAPVKAGAVR